MPFSEFQRFEIVPLEEIRSTGIWATVARNIRYDVLRVVTHILLLRFLGILMSSLIALAIAVLFTIVHSRPLI